MQCPSINTVPFGVSNESRSKKFAEEKASVHETLTKGVSSRKKNNIINSKLG